MSTFSLTHIPSPALHPHILLSSYSPAEESCNLVLNLSLPDAVFVDPHELEGIWRGINYTVHSDESTTAVDIERPVLSNSVAPRFTLELQVESGLELDIPFHARYLHPSESGSEDVILFTPEDVAGHWICGTDGRIYTLQGNAARQSIILTLPTGRLSHQPLVEVVTPLVIWLGWAYLLYKLIRLARRIPPAPKKKIA